MLLQPLETIDEGFLKKLCDDGYAESQTLEFKRDLPGSTDKDKHEICKDVSALANADGGDIVYGVNENGGVADCIAPIITDVPDAAIRRVSQVLDSGVEPRIQGLKIRHIDVVGGIAIVIRVPSSFDGPHCIRTNSNRRFVIRNGAGVVDMSFDQIRNAFDRTATLAEQARRFIAARRQLIADGNTPVPLMSGAQLALHLVPIAGQAGRKVVDLREVHSRTFTDFLGEDWGGGSRTFNLDGLVIHPGGVDPEGCYGYVHIFRNGAIEGVELGGALREVTPGVSKSIVWSLQMSKFFYSSMKTFLLAVRGWGYSGPALLSVSILNAKGYELGIDDAYFRFRRATADRENLVPSEVWIEDLETVDLDSTIRPLLDTLWQAFGVERCADFDEKTGQFSPRRR